MTPQRVSRVAGSRGEVTSVSTRVRSHRHTRGAGREALIIATQQVIATVGIGGVRLRLVAQTAGLSLGAATYHFPDRTEMIDEALDVQADDVRLLVAEAIADPGTGHDSVSVLELTLRRVYADRDHALITVELRAHSPRDAHARDVSRGVRADLRSLVVRLGGVSSIRAAQVIASLDAAVIDLACDHRDERRYATAMRRRIAAAMSGR